MINLKLSELQLSVIKDLIYDKIDQTDDNYYRYLINKINDQS